MRGGRKAEASSSAAGVEKRRGSFVQFDDIVVQRISRFSDGSHLRRFKYFFTRGPIFLIAWTVRVQKVEMRNREFNALRNVSIDRQVVALDMIRRLIATIYVGIMNRLFRNLFLRTQRVHITVTLFNNIASSLSQGCNA